MISQQIEKIKSEYTDKYVIVSDENPDLARFRDYVGQVKTVNMSGRALVEFGEFNQNIGWYDIDLDFLKVVPKPEPTPEKSKKTAAKKSANKPSAKKAPAQAGSKKLSPLELARQQGAAKNSGTSVEKTSATKKPSGKLSTADILAAARGGAGSSPASGKGEAKKSSGKMSTADILAAARGTSAKSPPEAKAEKPISEPSEPKIEATPDPIEVSDTSGPIDKSKMSIDAIFAWCREHDA